MGAAEEQKFFEDSDYPCLSIPRYLRIGYATAAMLDSETPGQLKAAFLSLLCAEGSVLYHTIDEQSCGLVVESTTHGAMLWQGDAMGFNDYRYFKLRTEGQPWVQATIWDPENWKVMPVVPRVPAWVWRNYADDAYTCRDLQEVTLQLLPQEYDSLLRYSASKAFPNFTLVQLQQLYDHLGVGRRRDGKRPRLLRDTLEAWLRDVLGDLSQEALEALLAQRDSKTCSWGSVVEANEDLVAEVVGEEDELAKTIEAKRRRKAQQKAEDAEKAQKGAPPMAAVEVGEAVVAVEVGALVAVEAPQAEAAAGALVPLGEPHEAAPRRRAAWREEHYTAEQAKELLPVTPGVSIST